MTTATTTRPAGIDSPVRNALQAMWPFLRVQVLGWVATSIVMFPVMMIVSIAVVQDPTFPISEIVVVNLRVWIVVLAAINPVLLLPLLVGQGVTRRTFVAAVAAMLATTVVATATLATAMVAIEHRLIPIGLDWASTGLPRPWDDPGNLPLVWLTEVGWTGLFAVATWATTATWYRFGWLAGVPSAVAAIALVALPAVVGHTLGTLAAGVTMVGLGLGLAVVVHRVTIATALRRSSPWTASGA